MSHKTRAAVFASGTGSNFEAIMNSDNLACEVVLLVCDKPEALVIEKAKERNVPTFVIDRTKYDSRESYETAIVEALQAADVEWIFLAGYMRIAGETLLQAYDGKIVNIHPSLLPKYPGLDAVGQAFRANDTKSGVTVHFVDEGIDTGPIIAQEAVDILPDDTVETLHARIQVVEHRLYPEVINQLINGGITHD